MNAGIYNAEQVIEERERVTGTPMPESPEAEVRRLVVGILTRKESGDRLGDVVKTVVDSLKQHGSFYHDPRFNDFPHSYHFSHTTRRLLSVKSDEFLAWLSQWTGLNRASHWFRHVLSEVESVALQKRHSRPAIPQAYWCCQKDVVYLSNGDGHICRIAAGEVRLADNGVDGVLFTAGKTLKPWRYLPDGRSAFLTCRLFKDANLNSNASLALFVLFVYSLPMNPPNKPPLCMNGPIRAGKTKLARGVATLFGIPENVILVDESRKDDVWIALNLGGLTILDNADSHIKWLPDLLAAASTGAGDIRRRKYKDDEEHRLSANSWIVVTTTNPTFAADAGLADRLLVAPMTGRDGRTEDAVLTAEVEENRDEGLSHVAKILSLALADTDPVPDTTPRHPDFGRMAIRIGRAMGHETDAIEALRSAEKTKAAFCVHNNKFASALLASLDRHGPFHGPPAALISRLVEMDKELDWLTDRKLGRQVGALWPHLREVLVEAEKTKTEDGVIYAFTSPPGGVPNPSPDS